MWNMGWEINRRCRENLNLLESYDKNFIIRRLLQKTYSNIQKEYVQFTFTSIYILHPDIVSYTAWIYFPWKGETNDVNTSRLETSRLWLQTEFSLISVGNIPSGILWDSHPTSEWLIQGGGGGALVSLLLGKKLVTEPTKMGIRDLVAEGQGVSLKEKIVCTKKGKQCQGGGRTRLLKGFRSKTFKYFARGINWGFKN